MKYLALTLAMLVPGLAQAASPEEAYLAARDKAVTALSAATSDGTGEDPAYKKAVADLKDQLSSIVGPVTVKGLTASVKLNADTLYKDDQGFGALDGLLYASADDKTNVVVTTQGLLQHWLGEHKTWYGEKYADLPQQAEEATKTDIFYTQAFQTDAAFVLYGSLPVAKPAGADFVTVQLAGRTQSEVPKAPDELLVTLSRGGRFYMIDAPLAGKMTRIPACAKLRAAAQVKAETLRKAYAASGNKDEKLFDQSTAAEEEGEQAYSRCYGEKASTQPAFAKALQQAQGLIDLLPAQ